MPSDLESASLTPSPEPVQDKARWVKVGLLAAASALAGGLAAAWWYRKTLASLQAAEEASDNPQIGILDDKPEVN
jgi:hypothetical protein